MIKIEAIASVKNKCKVSMKQFFYTIITTCLLVTFFTASLTTSAQGLLIDFSEASVEATPGGGAIIVIDDIPYSAPERGPGLDITGVDVQSSLSGGLEVVLPNTPVTFNSSGDAVIDYRHLPLVLGGNTFPEGTISVQAGTGGGAIIVIDDIPYAFVEEGPVYVELPGLTAHSAGGGAIIVIDDIPYSFQVPHLYWYGEYAQLNVPTGESLIGPNPVNQGQEIQVNSTETIHQIRVTNQQGVVVQEQAFHQPEGFIFTEELTPGYYWIYVDEGEGFTEPTMIVIQ